MKKILKYAVPILVFMIGLGVTLYPMVSNMWNQHRQNLLIDNYIEKAHEIHEDKLWELKNAAYEYNQALSGNLSNAATLYESHDEELYSSLLNVDGSGVMGYIEIPKINVRLAVYHGTEDDALDKGVGHLKGTSLPVGGESTHCVLTAHRGLPSAKLFTDLDELENSDLFYLNILGEKLAYEVDQILVVEPEEVESLRIIQGQDYVTLVTCTPYGVNSHRLLVRGHRTEVPPQESEEEEIPDSFNVNMLIVIPVSLLIAILLSLTVIKATKKKK